MRFEGHVVSGAQVQRWQCGRGSAAGCEHHHAFMRFGCEQILLSRSSYQTLKGRRVLTRSASYCVAGGMAAKTPENVASLFLYGANR